MFVQTNVGSMRNGAAMQQREQTNSSRSVGAQQEAKRVSAGHLSANGGTVKSSTTVNLGGRPFGSTSRASNSSSVPATADASSSQRPYSSTPSGGSARSQQVILPKTNALHSPSPSPTGTFKFALPLQRAGQSPSASPSAPMIAIPVLQLNQPAVTQNRMTITLGEQPSAGRVTLNANAASQPHNRFVVTNLSQNRVLINTSDDSIAKQHYAVGTNGSSNRLLVAGRSSLSFPVTLKHSPLPVNFTKLSASGFQSTPAVRLQSPPGLRASAPRSPSPQASGAVAQRIANSALRKAMRTALGSKFRSPHERLNEDGLSESPRECELCKRRLNLGNGISMPCKEYRFLDTVSTVQRSRDAAGNAKRRREDGDHRNGSGSEADSACELAKSDRNDYVERCAWVCTDCEKHFRSTNDVDSIAQCTCNERAPRRTRTAETCDGHRPGCDRYRFEKLRELRKKHAEWSLHNSTAMATLQHTTSLVGKCVSASIPTIKTERHSHMRSGATPQRDAANVDEPPHKLLKIMPNPLQSVCLQGSTGYGSAPRSAQQQQQQQQQQQRRLVPIQPKNGDAASPTLSPPCVVTMRRDMSDGAASYRVLTAGAGAGVGASASTNATTTTTTTQSGEQKRNASQSRPFWRWPQSEAPAPGAKHPDSSPSARLATVFDRLVRSEAEDSRRALPDRRDAPRPPTTDERPRVRTDCTGVAQPPRVAVVRPNARPGDQGQILPPKSTDNRVSTAPTFTRPLPHAASERKPSVASPMRTVRRYDKSRMRPVANFLFNLGLELVGQYVAKSEALTSQAESRPSTLEIPGLATDSVLPTSEPATHNVPPANEQDAHMKVEIADQNGETIDTLDVGSEGHPDAPTLTTSSDCLSADFHGHNQLAARLAHLECEAVCKCEFCGFVTESQLVFARHKLTGWIRWVSEADASEIERHIRAKASRRAARKRIRRRRAKPGQPVRSMNGQASEASHSPTSHPSESDSDSGSESSDSKDDLVVACRKLRRQPTVQALQQAPESDKDLLPRFASEWSIGEEPPDVFVGQCCACGFVATRYPFAYTAHLLTKHNISLTVDEATLSVARCPFCPYTLRTRNAVFKQHVYRCAARFDASTNQAPVSYIDELPVLLRGRQGPLVYELMEPEAAPESVYTSINPLAPFRRPFSTHRSARPPTEANLPFASLPSVSNFPPSDTVRIDVSRALESARHPARENDHQSSMRTGFRMPGNSNDVLRLNITSAGASLDPTAHADSDTDAYIANCHGRDVADATADELQLGTDGPLDASWIERNLNMVATSKLGEYAASVKRSVQVPQPSAAAPTSTSTAAALEGDYCTFCDKRIRVGTDPRYHFTGGHLVAIRVQIRNCKCPFCNVPYSVSAPSVRFADVNHLHQHILAEHAQRQHRKAFWWVHVSNALRASGSTVNDPEADIQEDASSYVEMLKLATKPKLPTATTAPALDAHKQFPASAADRPFDLTATRIRPSEPGLASVSPVKRPTASSSVNDGFFCIFCAQSIRSKSNAYQHFVSNHLIALRNKIHKRLCPLCELPGQPAVSKHASRFATVIKLHEHVEKMHRMLYRSPSAYWWPYVHSELRRAVRSSTDASTSAPASTVSAATQPYAAAAHATQPSSATLPAAIARDRKGRPERAAADHDAAANYDARSASDRPAASTAPNAKQSSGTYCAFCAQNISTNTYLQFSGEHLVLLGIQIGKLECPLCCLSGAAAPCRFTDVADLTAHVTAEHAPTYRSAYWWPYLSAALSTAARTSVRARVLNNASRPPGRPPKLADTTTAPGPRRKRPDEPDLTTERVEPTRVKAPPTAASHCLFCAKTITVNALYHFSGAHLSTMRSQVRNCECPLCGPTASASASPQTGPYCFSDIRKLQEHCESVHGQYRNTCWWQYLIAAFRAALAFGRSGPTGTGPRSATTAANSVADYASNGLALAREASHSAEDDNLHAMIKID